MEKYGQARREKESEHYPLSMKGEDDVEIKTINGQQEENEFLKGETAPSANPGLYGNAG